MADIQFLRCPSFLYNRLSAAFHRCLFRDDVWVHYHRCECNRKRRTTATFTKILAFVDSLDRRTRNCFLHHSHNSIACGWKYEGVLCRGYRTDTCQDAPAIEDHREMDMEHVRRANHSMRHLFLPRRHGRFRQCELLNGNHRYRRLRHP